MMTKADIIEHVYEKVGSSKKESTRIVEMVFEIIKDTLERGEKIKIATVWQLCGEGEENASG
jgi:integration host factor subunit alpha